DGARAHGWLLLRGRHGRASHPDRGDRWPALALVAGLRGGSRATGFVAAGGVVVRVRIECGTRGPVQGAIRRSADDLLGVGACGVTSRAEGGDQANDEEASPPDGGRVADPP